MNRNAGGLVKRKPLEEVKEGSVPLLNVCSRREDLSMARSGFSTLALVPSPSSHSSWEQQIISCFWESYAPSSTSANATCGHAAWLYHAIRSPNSVPALEQALVALAVTRFGRNQALNHIIRHGQKTYGHALCLLQDALFDQQLMFNDEILASVRALVLYEVGLIQVVLRNVLIGQVFESTSSNPNAWQRHLTGMTSLLIARGPHRHCSPISRAVLEDVRYPLVSFAIPDSNDYHSHTYQMLQALMVRKASPFGEQDWRDIPWTNQTKDSYQQLYDFGFRLAALLEAADRLKDVPVISEGIQHSLVILLQNFNALDQSLDNLFDGSFQPFLLSRSIFGSRARSQASPISTSFSPTDMISLVAILNLWALQLLASFTADSLKRKLLERDEDFIKDGGRSVEDVCHTAQSYSSNTARSDLALMISRFMPLCVGKNASEYVVSRTIFPAFTLSVQSRTSDTQSLQSKEFINQISEERNIRFAGRYYRPEKLVPEVDESQRASTVMAG